MSHNLVGAGDMYVHNTLVTLWKILMRHIHRIGYVAATLILLQIFPSQMAFRPLGNEVARGQTIEQRRKEAIRLNNLGVEQLEKSEYQEALKTFEQALAITKQIGDKATEGTILSLCRLQRLQRLKIKPLTLLSFSTTYRVVT